MHPLTRRRAAAALSVYGLVLAVMLLGSSTLPSALIRTVMTWGQDVGLPQAVLTSTCVGFVLNVIALMPVSASGSLIWPETNWRDWTAAGFVISVGVELAQTVVLPGRTATFVDVVANTLGAALGALAVRLLWSGDDGRSEG